METGGSEISSRSLSQRSQFVHKLHSLLENPLDADSLRWTDDLIFEISCSDERAINALSPNWDFNSLGSFIRQLSYYGFKRLSDRRRSGQVKQNAKEEFIIFSHPSGLFRRGDSSRLDEIGRKARSRITKPNTPSPGGTRMVHHSPHRGSPHRYNDGSYDPHDDYYDDRSYRPGDPRRTNYRHDEYDDEGDARMGGWSSRGPSNLPPRRRIDRPGDRDRDERGDHPYNNGNRSHLYAPSNLPSSHNSRGIPNNYNNFSPSTSPQPQHRTLAHLNENYGDHRSRPSSSTSGYSSTESRNQQHHQPYNNQPQPHHQHQQHQQHHQQNHHQPSHHDNNNSNNNNNNNSNNNSQDLQGNRLPPLLSLPRPDNLHSNNISGGSTGNGGRDQSWIPPPIKSDPHRNLAVPSQNNSIPSNNNNNGPTLSFRQHPLSQLHPQPNREVRLPISSERESSSTSSPHLLSAPSPAIIPQVSPHSSLYRLLSHSPPRTEVVGNPTPTHSHSNSVSSLNSPRSDSLPPPPPSSSNLNTLAPIATFSSKTLTVNSIPTPISAAPTGWAKPFPPASNPTSNLTSNSVASVDSSRSRSNSLSTIIKGGEDDIEMDEVDELEEEEDEFKVAMEELPSLKIDQVGKKEEEEELVVVVAAEDEVERDGKDISSSIAGAELSGRRGSNIKNGEVVAIVEGEERLKSEER